MRPSGWLLLTQLSICTALAASAALYVHYLNPADSDFCGPSSGCEAVRRSGLSYFLGSRFVSLPLFALLAFGALLGLSLRRRPAAPAPPGDRVGLWTHLWHEPTLTLFTASGIGAIGALLLVGYQALVVGAYCWLCLIVDGAVIASAVFAFLLARATRDTAVSAVSPLSAAAWFAIASLVVGAPILWSAIKPPPDVPPPIAALYRPGKINVIEFADFECPYCRRLHAILGPLVVEYGEQVHVQRVHRPLFQHVNAEHAARAALCAAEQGKSEAMADALFSETLSPEAIPRIAERLGLDPAAFDPCITAERTTATLAEHAALLPDDQLRGLPTTYVGDKLFVGVPSEAALRDAFERAKGPPRSGPTGYLYVAALVAALAMAVFFGRRRMGGVLAEGSTQHR
jgi:protein-disulfide isomerase